MSQNYKESVYSGWFELHYACQTSLNEWRSWPVGFRDWTLKKLVDKKEAEAKAAKGEDQTEDSSTLPFDRADLQKNVLDNLRDM